MNSERVLFRKLHNDAIIPSRATNLSAGFDLYALEDTSIIGGLGNILVSTGISARLPAGTYGRIAIRSGLAFNAHLGVSAGVIDRDYTGEIKVLVFCTKIFRREDTRHQIDPSTSDYYIADARPTVYFEPHSYLIKKGERFAQIVIERVSECPCEYDNDNNLVEVSLFEHRGFGSTGKT